MEEIYTETKAEFRQRMHERRVKEAKKESYRRKEQENVKLVK